MFNKIANFFKMKKNKVSLPPDVRLQKQPKFTEKELKAAKKSKRRMEWFQKQ